MVHVSKCKACKKPFIDHLGVEGTCSQLQSTLKKWSSDRYVLIGVLKFMVDNKIKMDSSDLLQASKSYFKELEDAKHRIFELEELLREHGILEYGN